MESSNTTFRGKELLAELFKYQDKLFAYIYNHVRNWADTEDLVQETVAVIMKHSEENTEVVNFGAWSREIARRLILEHWRTKKREQMLTEKAAEAIEMAFSRHDSEPAENGVMDRLQKCVEALPEQTRKIIDFFYAERLSLQEIGKQMKRSTGAIQVALFRTRLHLQDCVKRVPTNDITANP